MEHDQGVGQVVMRVGVVAAQADGVAKGGGGRLQQSRRLQGRAQVVVQFGRGIAGRDRSAAAFGRFLIAVLGAQQLVQVVREDLLGRISGDPAAQVTLGLFELTGSSREQGQGVQGARLVGGRFQDLLVNELRPGAIARLGGLLGDMERFGNGLHGGFSGALRCSADKSPRRLHWMNRSQRL